MPYKSDILNKIYIDNKKIFDDIYTKIEIKCIESDFNLLTKRDHLTKNKLTDIIINNIDIQKHIKNS